jgi:hypothetical protein
LAERGNTVLVRGSEFDRYDILLRMTRPLWLSQGLRAAKLRTVTQETSFVSAASGCATDTAVPHSRFVASLASELSRYPGAF